MIVVTGASGNVGREVVTLLVARGVPVRAALRHYGARASTPGLEPVSFDFNRPESFAPTLRGASAVFLMRPPAIARVQDTLNAFVDAAVAANVQHVVLLSVAGAGENRLVPHHAVERHLKRCGIPWTILRPGFFAQNIGDAYARDIAEDDRLFVPAGYGRVAFIDVRDVAEVAVAAFVDPAAHRERAWTLTGPEAVSFTDVARELSTALSRSIQYQPASVIGYARHLAARELPAAQILVQTLLHVGLRFGQADTVDPTLAHLLDHPPRTIRTYIRDHLARWKRPPI